MSDGGKLRIGIEGARELEIEVEDVEAAATQLEKGIGGGTVVWLIDTKGSRHGIVVERLAFVIVEAEKDRSIGFGAGS